jgi:hypothetical protein
MCNFENELDEALKEIMDFYKCDNPLEALIKYSKDYEEELRDIIYDDGGTEEDVQQTLEEEFAEFELERMSDPEVAACYNKLSVLMKEYPKD